MSASKSIGFDDGVPVELLALAFSLPPKGQALTRMVAEIFNDLDIVQPIHS
jgi:hypothetical protein